MESNALVAPKINDLYNQKSTHLVDKFKRMYKININAIFIFAVLILPFSFLANMPYMGIPMFFLFIFMIYYSVGFKKKLDKVETNSNSYQYLNSFNEWVKEMIAFNTISSRFLYPYVFLSMALGFWFGSFGGDIPGEEFLSMLLSEYPEMLMVFGLPLIGVIGVFAVIALLAFYGGKIGQFDLNLVYGRILKKLDGMLTEMEELRA